MGTIGVGSGSVCGIVHRPGPWWGSADWGQCFQVTLPKDPH